MENQSDHKEKHLFTEKAVQNISELITLLQQIRRRLKEEGIDINSYVEPMSIPRKKPVRKKL